MALLEIKNLHVSVAGKKILMPADLLNLTVIKNDYFIRFLNG